MRFTLKLIFLITLMFTNTLFAGRWTTLAPDGGKRIVLIIKGKEWVYYRLEPGEQMVYDVNEKSEYRIITRVDFRDSKQREVLYAFRLGWDESEGKLIGRGSTRASKRVHPKGKKYRVGKSKIIEITPAPDRHELHFSLDDNARHAVYFRVQRLRTEFTDAAKYIAFNPSNYEEQVKIVTNERTSNYYLIDDSDRLRVDVIGPTVLKVHVRLAMDKSIYDRTRRSIVIYEDGERKNRKVLQFISSKVSWFEDNPSQVPSKAETLYIEAPEGKHQYSFKQTEETGEMIIRVFLLAKDLEPQS